METTLQTNYDWCCQFGGDMKEHMPTLKRYAEQVKHITEFGVRDVISTWAFLLTRPETLISYDINDNSYITHCKNVSASEGQPWSFIIGDTLELTIEPTDLLFIDTLHTYDQLTQELTRHADKVRKYIILHNTTTFEHVSQFVEGSKTG